VVTLFDAGRINALSDQARAAYDENAAAYRKTVLTAYQEVEDNLVALRQLEQEDMSQNRATNAADRALQQSNDRYTGGLITYLDVVVAQNTALQARLTLIDIETRRLTSSVQLIKALGGSWDAPKVYGPQQPLVPAAPPAPIKL
jgi:outer membrane protein TolC